MGWVAGYDVTWPHSFGKELLRRFEKQRLWGPVPAEGTGSGQPARPLLLASGPRAWLARGAV